LKGSPIYDGLRQFLFVVPIMVVMAALALDVAAEATRGFIRRTGAGTVALLAALALHGWIMVRTMIHLHPHHYVYFNRVLGGVGAAVGVYSTDYYGETFREAVTATADKLWHEEPEYYLKNFYNMGGCTSSRTAKSYLPPNFRWRGRRARLDFYTGYTRYHCHERYKRSPEFLRIERQGGMLNVVHDLRLRSRRPIGSLIEQRRPPPDRDEAKEDDGSN
jgi:hypothetical protein